MIIIKILFAPLGMTALFILGFVMSDAKGNKVTFLERISIGFEAASQYWE